MSPALLPRGAILHLGSYGVELTLSYHLEIFIFAHVIHSVQVANSVNAMYSLCPHGCFYK
uniref:Uncharacterized protein n=1 Tax=Piliocolobus tephrosceles TaxID=591936 RepID=A0A8C9HKB5_9PRIM